MLGTVEGWMILTSSRGKIVGQSGGGPPSSLHQTAKRKISECLQPMIIVTLEPALELSTLWVTGAKGGALDIESVESVSTDSDVAQHLRQREDLVIDLVSEVCQHESNCQ